MTRGRLRLGAAFALVSVTLLLAFSADAQHGKPHKPPPHPSASHKPAADAGAGTTLTVESPKANPDAGVLEAKMLDGGTRVFRFGEMEVEGRLRSPQIVYFLRRVRAEFAAGDLGHRSFMGELSDTRRANAF
jgi:hypothetical protein